MTYIPNVRHLLLGIGAFSLLACSDRVAGGGSTGSEAGNAITATVVLSTGTPAAYAQSYLRPADYQAGDPIDERYTFSSDKNGRVQLDSIPQGEWVLEVQSAGTGILYPISIHSKDTAIDLGIDTLHTHTILRGTVPTPVQPGTQVVVQGTHHFAVPNDQGLFSLDSLPAGTHVLKTTSPAQTTTLNGYAFALPGSVNNIGPLSAETDYLMIEDFEDDNTIHRLGPLSGEGYWFANAHTEVMVTPDITTLLPKEFDTIRNSNVMHFSVEVPATTFNPWSDRGFQIGRKDQAYDLSSVDSIVFWARGSGTLILALHDVNPLYANDPLQRHFVLLPEWVRHSIPITALGSAPTGVTLTPKTVTSLSLIFTEDGELWIDDIQFIGADRASIWR